MSPSLRRTRRLKLWMFATAIVGLVALDAGLALRERAKRASCAAGGADHTSCALPRTGTSLAAAPKAGADLPLGPVVLQFTSEACPACRAMEPILRDAHQQCAAAGATVVPMDVESTAGGALATRSNVTETPTLLLLDAAHHEVARLVGRRSIAELRKTIEGAYGVTCAAPPGAPATSGG